MSFELRLGDCIEAMRGMADASVDAVVTDPPYELNFMSRRWDNTGIAYSVELWREVIRVLKPGGHLLAFGGSRTSHRMVCAIEDAGFEIRDGVQWWYGSGFPKSRDVGKEFEENEYPDAIDEFYAIGSAASAAAAKYFDGRGTALKPAFEPICLARKPLEGTVAANVLKHGTGALNIDACRVATAEPLGRFNNAKPVKHRVSDDHPDAKHLCRMQQTASLVDNSKGLGRWPANLIIDEAVAAMLDEQSGVRTGAHGGGRRGAGGQHGSLSPIPAQDVEPGARSVGGASRFYYVAKPSASERDAGLEAFAARTGGEATDREDGSDGLKSPRAGAGRNGGRKNVHPTVKPIALMRYLCRLITPPGGIVLDPFMGSGTTGCAAVLEGSNFVGIDQSADYIEIAKARIENWKDVARRDAEATRREQQRQQDLFEKSK